MSYRQRSPNDGVLDRGGVHIYHLLGPVNGKFFLHYSKNSIPEDMNVMWFFLLNTVRLNGESDFYVMKGLYL